MAVERLESTMVFSSSEFLFAFLPMFLLFYFISPNRQLKNIWLLAASLVFYAWGEPVYVLLMIVSVFCNWVFALALETRTSRRKAILALAVVFNLMVIGFFKYEGFLSSVVQGIVGFELLPNLNLPLPIGISFYTLQALSYVIDVYRREVDAQRNVLFLGMYIACFPQLIAGPIVRYQTIADQIVGRKENLSDFSSGLRLFIVGLAKKALLANTCAILADEMLALGGSSIGAVGAWGGIIAYTFQIYFDFSGYSDMAIGLGRMLGFSYLRNFNYPYISKNITEFWRRWHISLSTFFRDYLYIPLGGSRCSTGRWVFNLAVVWATTGLWHGAAWNYVLWGVYYGALLIVEKLFIGKWVDKLPGILQHAYALIVVIFGWTFFWITDIDQLIVYWAAMAGRFGATGSSTLWQLNVWEYIPVLMVCALVSTPVVPYLKKRLACWLRGEKLVDFMNTSVLNPRHIAADEILVFDVVPSGKGKESVLGIARLLTDAALLILLGVSVLTIVSGSYNPFIYFQF